MNTKPIEEKLSDNETWIDRLLENREWEKEHGIPSYDGLCLGERVRKLRHFEGVGRRVLALEAGLSESAILAVEYGHTPNVGSVTAYRLASYFGISVDQLLTGRKSSTRDELIRNI